MVILCVRIVNHEVKGRLICIRKQCMGGPRITLTARMAVKEAKYLEYICWCPIVLIKVSPSIEHMQVQKMQHWKYYIFHCDMLSLMASVKRCWADSLTYRSRSIYPQFCSNDKMIIIFHFLQPWLNIFVIVNATQHFDICYRSDCWPLWWRKKNRCIFSIRLQTRKII